MIMSFSAGCISLRDTVNPPEESTMESAEFMLSFDDGPLPDKTERILEMLATLRSDDGSPIKAGFFLLADAPDEFWQQRMYYAPYELWTDKGSIAKYPEIARRIQNAGHIIGNHSTHHGWLRWPWLNTPQAVLGEFTEWEAIVKPVLGTSNSHLFRPPYFLLNAIVRNTARQLGYRIVMGESVGDAIPDVTLLAIKAKAQSILMAWKKPYPCLLIFHENRPVTYMHLDEIVRNLQWLGFRLVHFDSKRLRTG